jgi:ABC-2 type transport system permease protein
MSSRTISLPASATRVRFIAVLRSEWIKARSVPAPSITAGATIGAAALFSLTVPIMTIIAPLGGTDAGPLISDAFGVRPSLRALAYGFTLTQPFIAVLGVLLVTSERASGLLNVTLAAVPKRNPVLGAKLVLSGASGFVLGLLVAGVTMLVTQPFLIAAGLADSLWSNVGVQVVLGGAASLALVSTLGTALGSLFTNTGAAAGVVLSFIVVVPSILRLLPGVGGVASQAMPSSAALLLIQPADIVDWSSLGIASFILVCWVAAATGVAALRWKRMDV